MKLASSAWLLLVICVLNVRAQERTVGLLKNTREGNDSYTLIAPLFNNSAYLINDCGEAVHAWQSTNRPGASTYLLPNTHLLKSEYYPESTFTIGGVGGIIKVLDWESNVVWEYQISNDSLSHHHDVYPMPNGNFLVLVWHKREEAEVLANGRDEELYHSLIVSEEIWEVKPIGSNEGEIVWKWSSWDHIVQDVYPDKPNYGQVNDKGRINLNYAEGLSAGREWLHMNSIEYDEVNDFVIVSVRHFHETWVIDHSTTMEEAKSESGGNYNQGGKVLFRFGNSRTYGGETEQKFFGQHDVRVLESNLGYLKLKVFNNGATREPSKSQVDLVEITFENGFENDSNGDFAANYSNWITPTQDFFYSSITSGAQLLDDGNRLLTTLGASGRLIEFNTETKEINWQYISPITGDGAVEQGVDPVSPDPTKSNTLFKAINYESTYSGLKLNEFNMSPTPLELNPLRSPCEVVLSDPLTSIKVQVYVNEEKNIVVRGDFEDRYQLSFYTLDGKVLIHEEIEGNTFKCYSGIPQGLVIVKLTNATSSRTFKLGL